MARYDPQRSRARARPEADAPAPVDALLGATGPEAVEAEDEVVEEVALDRAVGEEAALEEEIVEQAAPAPVAVGDEREAAAQDRAARDEVNRATAYDATYRAPAAATGRRRSPLLGVAVLLAVIGAVLWLVRRMRRRPAPES